MSATTLFLSQIIGPVILMMGIAMATNPSYIKSMLKKFYKNESSKFTIGTFLVPAGIALVLHHNLWTTLPEILVSVMGWGMILEGGTYLIAPGITTAIAKRMDGKCLCFWGIVTLIIGILMTYFGFFA